MVAWWDPGVKYQASPKSWALVRASGVRYLNTTKKYGIAVNPARESVGIYRSQNVLKHRVSTVRGRVYRIK